jgi:hypothetical protein
MNHRVLLGKTFRAALSSHNLVFLDPNRNIYPIPTPALTILKDSSFWREDVIRQSYKKIVDLNHLLNQSHLVCMSVLCLTSCRQDAQDYVGATDIWSICLGLCVVAFQLEVA